MSYLRGTSVLLALSFVGALLLVLADMDRKQTRSAVVETQASSGRCEFIAYELYDR